MRENPLNYPKPVDPILRAHSLARDLAFGVASEAWLPYFPIMHQMVNLYTLEDETMVNLFDKKWDGERFATMLLEPLGYVTVTGEVNSLTVKAFALLDQPAAPPSVFISYKTGESTALALAIEARLKLAGNPNPYLDKLITPGTHWRKSLEERLQTVQYLVVCLGPDAAQSEFIRQEIAWAQKHDKQIISICLPGMRVADSGIAGLDDIQAIPILGNRAIDYENAINALLNALGYGTY